MQYFLLFEIRFLKTVPIEQGKEVRKYNRHCWFLLLNVAVLGWTSGLRKVYYLLKVSKCNRRDKSSVSTLITFLQESLNMFWVFFLGLTDSGNQDFPYSSFTTLKCLLLGLNEPCVGCGGAFVLFSSMRPVLKDVSGREFGLDLF